MTDRLKRIFREEQVPEFLVALAEVESSWNPDARSPCGAVGLFQLMPATALSFGLRLQPDDERLDPYKNAGAAARYLHALHQRFGCWRLALAAYNAGEGRISRLLDRCNATSFDAIAHALPEETAQFVPKVSAAIERAGAWFPEG